MFPGKLTTRSTPYLKAEIKMTEQARAPKAEDYSIVPGWLGPRRDFRISVGLREGWDAEGRVFDVSEAVAPREPRSKTRVEAGEPALSGMFTRAEVTYAWPRPDDTVGSDREPVALFTGEAVHAYLGHSPTNHRGDAERTVDRAWRGTRTGANLRRICRPDLDSGCRRALDGRICLVTLPIKLA